MGGATQLLRFEGFNFAATVYDTNDLSTVRGSSLALDEAAATVEAALRATIGPDVEKIFTGASQGAYAFSGDPQKALAAVRAALTKTSSPPLQYLTFAVDAVAIEAGDDAQALAQALAQAEARNRSAQFRNWTFAKLPDLDPKAEAYDHFDRLRPATQKRGDEWISESGLARYKYGQGNRQAFYAKRASPQIAESLHFTDSFEDLVACPPKGLPVSLQRKMAVIHIDGNHFSKIVGELGVGPFSRQLQAKHQLLLDDILDWFHADGQFDPRFHVKNKEGFRACRLETLLWGGEDIDLVMPCWLAFEFAELFFENAGNWRFELPDKTESGVTHTMGIIICDRKTPIRLARSLAHDSVDRAKEATSRADCVTFDIFEGTPPPDDGLAAHRARFYGLDHNAPDNLAAQIAFPADRLAAMRAQITGFKNGDKLPRSKIYAVLEKVRIACDGKYVSAEASKLTQGEIETYFQRVANARIPFDDLCLPALATAPKRPLALQCVLATQFWDYADPLDAEAAGK